VPSDTETEVKLNIKGLRHYPAVQLPAGRFDLRNAAAHRDHRPPVGRSNSPLWTPPMNASHSAGVKFKTVPLGCLLSRTRILFSVRPATSTQLPLYPLSELFIHIPAELLADRRLVNIGKSCIEPTFVVGL
jgi:hypothetical protein